MVVCGVPYSSAEEAASGSKYLARVIAGASEAKDEAFTAGIAGNAGLSRSSSGASASAVPADGKRFIAAGAGRVEVDRRAATAEACLLLVASVSVARTS